MNEPDHNRVVDLLSYAEAATAASKCHRDRTHGELVLRVTELEEVMRKVLHIAECPGARLIGGPEHQRCWRCTYTSRLIRKVLQ